MSKLIVDQIAKNGGVPLTIPAADGVANAVIKTDGSGALGFSGFGLPSTDGTSGQVLKKGSGTTSSWGSVTLAPADAHNVIATVHSSSSRENIYSTGEWGSSGAWTTYYNDWQDANSITQGWNMLMGDGYPEGTTQQKYSNDKDTNEARLIEYATQNRVGYSIRQRFEYDNHTSNYSGCTWRVLPVRNTTSASITRSISTRRSGGGGSYGGHNTAVYTPDAATYSGATSSGVWTRPGTGSSTSEGTGYTESVGIIVPANTTVLVVNTSGWSYETTYWFKDSNLFYNLDAFFPDSKDLVCDLRMVDAIATIRVQGETNSSSSPHKVYNQCALKHGDR